MKVKPSARWAWWPIHRPYLVAWRNYRESWGLFLEWGDGNSDPVWSIGVEIQWR